MEGPSTDHDVIRRWAERHSASPAEIKPRKFDGEAAVLWFLFKSGGTEDICSITWEDFFARFDLLGLKLLFDDTPDFELVHMRKSPEELGILPT